MAPDKARVPEQGTGAFILPPEARQFFDYWKSLRKPGEGLIPRRDDFNPAQVKSLLKDITICDLEPYDIRYRLVGTALAERSHLEITGHYLSEFTSKEQMHSALSRGKVAFSHPCGLYRQYEETYGPDINCNLEVYTLPLLTRPHQFDQMITLCLPLGYQKPGWDDYAGYRFSLNRDDMFIDIGAGVPDETLLLSVV